MTWYFQNQSVDGAFRLDNEDEKINTLRDRADFLFTRVRSRVTLRVARVKRK